MKKLEKLYDEDFLKDYLFKTAYDLKAQATATELGENIVSYLEKFVNVKKITNTQLDAVKKVCDKILNEDKNNLTCLNLKSMIYYYHDNLVQALKNVNNSLKIDKDQFLANFIIINILFEKDSLELSLKYANKTISQNPDCKYCYLIKGIILHHMDNYTDAITCFNKVLEEFGPNLSALAHKSLALFRIGKTDEALDLSDSVLTISNDNLFALINKGLILAKKQDYEEAIEVFNKYAEKRRDIRILTHLKNCYQKIQNLEKVAEYEKEIKSIVSKKRKEKESEKKKQNK